MKKLLVLSLFLLCSAVFAESLKGGIKNDYEDYLETVNLTVKQREQIMRIRNEENYAIKPLVLDIQSKEEGLEFLNSLKCGHFDVQCKLKHEANIKEKEAERDELLRKINQKKNYYKLRYRNVLTREQDHKIQELIKENEHRDKVLMERAEKAKKQERIDRLKVWNKFKKKS